jgi:hypothetical protein
MDRDGEGGELKGKGEKKGEKTGLMNFCFGCLCGGMPGYERDACIGSERRTELTFL